jgi:formate C-acetyltransferase
MVWGVNNAADGLMAIKKLVFDEKKLTLETFVKAVESNYQGEYEWVRREIESGVPRFGNDNDEVDALSKKIMLKAKEVADHSIDIY